MADVLMGAVAMGALVAALFFARFWRRTGDRFFLLFALAFGLDSLTRFAIGLSEASDEQQPYFYLARLITYGLILLAVIDKNRTEKTRKW